MDASKQTISPLRQRMVEDMRMRKFGEKTQLDYVRAVRNFTKYLGRSPDSATVEDLRNYPVASGRQRHLAGLAQFGDQRAEVLLQRHPRPT